MQEKFLERTHQVNDWPNAGFRDPLFSKQLACERDIHARKRMSTLVFDFSHVPALDPLGSAVSAHQQAVVALVLPSNCKEIKEMQEKVTHPLTPAPQLRTLILFPPHTYTCPHPHAISEALQAVMTGIQR